MKSFIGTYECKIDDKGRIKIPSALSKQMEGFADQPFVVKRAVFQKCLEVYPMSAWEKLTQRINRLNRFVKKNVDFIRMFNAGVKTVELDKVERIQISKDLIQYANLSKEVVLTTQGELFEIWDKTAYEAAISIDDEEFTSLAEEVMGSLDVNNDVS